MPSRLYMLGICRQVTPYANVMKLGRVGLVGYVITLTAVGLHRLTGFGVSRHPSWVPSIDKAHRAYYTAVPATAGTHDRRHEVLLAFILARAVPKFGSVSGSGRKWHFRKYPVIPEKQPPEPENRKWFFFLLLIFHPSNVVRHQHFLTAAMSGYRQRKPRENRTRIGRKIGESHVRNGKWLTFRVFLCAACMVVYSWLTAV